MQIKNIEPKNSRAVTQLKGWLSSLNIPVSTSKTDGADLTITAANGTTVDLQLRAADSTIAPSTTVVIEAATITGRNIQAALDIAQSLVETLGYTWSNPVERGPLPKSKAHYSDDFEDVAFRHTEFRRAPNPTKAEMEKYAKIVNLECYRFMSHWPQVCSDNMWTVDDLRTYAQVWLVNYLGVHAISEERDSGNENVRKLRAYLGQRFEELRQLAHKKGRNVFTHLDEASIALYGVPFVYRASMGGRGDGGKDRNNFWDIGAEDIQEKGTDEEYVARNQKIDTRTSFRKDSAAAFLDKSLAALPHDKMVELLTTASSNHYIDPTARREAGSRLRAHCATCVHCAAVSMPPEENEEAPGIDTVCALE